MAWRAEALPLPGFVIVPGGPVDAATGFRAGQAVIGPVTWGGGADGDGVSAATAAVRRPAGEVRQAAVVPGALTAPQAADAQNAFLDDPLLP